MKCIFCKCPSDASQSKEHIIPESLGNKEHILAPGWVCDACNNYLARKVEAPFLESSYGQNSRFEMGIQNKRDLYTPGVGLHPASRSKIHLRREDDSSFSVSAAPGEDEARFIETLRTQKSGSLYLPAAELPPTGYETSRFIAKIGLEILAQRGMDDPKWNEEIVNKVELDDIRTYVRQGRPGVVWPVVIRRIYPADFAFSDNLYPRFQMLHEWNLLWIEDPVKPIVGVRGEFYAVIAIFGVEYVINLGGPDLYGYERWRKKNGDRSFLYR